MKEKILVIVVKLEELDCLVKDPIGRQTVSTNLDPRDLSDTEPPTVPHTLAGPRIPTHTAKDRLIWPQ